MKVDNKTRLSILDELRPEKQQEGDVTTKEAADVWEVSVSTAREVLEYAVKVGRLEKIHGVRFEGRKGIFYRRVVKLEVN